MKQAHFNMMCKLADRSLEYISKHNSSELSTGALSASPEIGMSHDYRSKLSLAGQLQLQTQFDKHLIRFK